MCIRDRSGGDVWRLAKASYNHLPFWSLIASVLNMTHDSFHSAIAHTVPCVPLGNAPYFPPSNEPIPVPLRTSVHELAPLFGVTAICKLAFRSLGYSCRFPASYTMDQHSWAHGGFLWNPSYTASRSLLHSHALSHPLLTLSLPILSSTQSRAP